MSRAVVVSSIPSLPIYSAARVALAKAHYVDEAKGILDQAEALRVYARQRDDAEMERWVAEIKLRAVMRIGEISKKLKRAPSGRAAVSLPANGKSKREVLKAAGISTSAAHRAEKFAVPGAREAVEDYIATQIAMQKPITVDQALKAVGLALRPHDRAELAPEPKRPSLKAVVTGTQGVLQSGLEQLRPADRPPARKPLVVVIVARLAGDQVTHVEWNETTGGPSRQIVSPPPQGLRALAEEFEAAR